MLSLSTEQDLHIVQKTYLFRYERFLWIQMYVQGNFPFGSQKHRWCLLLYNNVTCSRACGPKINNFRKQHQCAVVQCVALVGCGMRFLCKWAENSIPRTPKLPPVFWGSIPPPYVTTGVLQQHPTKTSPHRHFIGSTGIVNGNSILLHTKYCS